jgi:hypothetical protein
VPLAAGLALTLLVRALRRRAAGFAAECLLLPRLSERDAMMASALRPSISNGRSGCWPCFPAALLWLLARRDGDPMLQWRRVIDPALLPHLIVGGARRARIRPGDWLLSPGTVVAAVAVAGRPGSASRRPSRMPGRRSRSCSR